MSQHDSPPITEVLPPETLLDTDQRPLIRGGIACMHDIDTVRQYVAYENGHRNRVWVLHLLAERAETLRGTDSDTAGYEISLRSLTR